MLENPRYERFARLIAAGKTGPQAYTGAGFAVRGARQSAARLLAKPEVARRVEEIRREINRSIIQRTITDKQARIDSYDDYWGLLEQVRRERASSPEMQRVPGGQTGLLVRTLKSVNTEVGPEVVEEFEIDVALLRERREYAEQAAKESGQWVDKSERRIIRSIEDLSNEELQALAGKGNN